MNAAKERFGFPRSVGRGLVRWIGAREREAFVLLTLVAGGIWAFVEIADEVLEGEAGRIDEWVRARLPHGSPYIEEVMRDFTALGGVAVLALLVLSVAGFLALQRRWRTLVFLLIAIAGGVLFSQVFKVLFDRPRPPGSTYDYTASFPSGHSAMATVTYFTLAAILIRVQRSARAKAYLLVLAVIVSVLVGFSRVWLGVHWATDVLGGWTLGGAWALLVWYAAMMLQRRGQMETDAHADDDDDDQQGTDHDRQ